jgi:hypothetical protein
MERIMGPFWKKLCENKLLPLTTLFGYQKENRKLTDLNKYMTEDNFVDKKYKGVELENLCLRLTQNFQLVSPKGILDVELSKDSNTPHFSMCFRDRYSFTIPDFMKIDQVRI